ncbi:MAG: PAS domain S-box protein [Thiohalobacteraceae bacterium]
MSWNEDSRRRAGLSGSFLHEATASLHELDRNDVDVVALDGLALMQTLGVIARRTATSVALLTRDLQIVGSVGELFDSCRIEPATATRRDELPDIVAHLNDPTLESDLAAAFERQSPPLRMLVAATGQWLERTIDLLEGAESRALVGYRDVTVERHHQFLMEGQRLVLDAVARQERPEDIFHAFARLIEAGSPPGTHASVLWLQDGGRRLYYLAGPSLPKNYLDGMSDGIPVGPSAGTCGTAAYRRRRVVTDDIASDPKWNAGRDIALAAGLRACWSQPIFATDGGVLGTFALYRETPGAPSAVELRVLEMAVQTAAIAMSDLRAEDETRFQAALLDNVQEAVVATDCDGRIRHWSLGAETLLGYAAEDMLGRPVDSILELSNGYTAAAQSGAWNGEISLRKETERTATIEVSLSEVADTHRGRRGFVGILRDVTQRRAAERRLVAQSRRHRAVAHLGRIALADCDLQALLDETVQLLAEVFDVPLCKVLEFEPDGASLLLRAGVGWCEGLVGTARVDTEHGSPAGYAPSSAPVVVEELGAETRFTDPSLLSVHGVVSGMSAVIQGVGERPFGVLGVHARERRDFTEEDENFLQSVANLLSQTVRRRQGDESLRHSEQRFRDLADAMPHVVWSADAAGRADYFNERWCKLGGSRPGQPDFDAWRSLVHPDDLPAWKAAWNRCVASGTLFETECRVYVDASGEYRWHLARAVPVHAPNGDVLRWYGSSTDIDQQKRTEHQLIEQTRRLELINWVNTALASELDFETLVQRVVDVGAQLSGAAFGVYLQPGGADRKPVPVAVSGDMPDGFDAAGIPCIAQSFGEGDGAGGLIRCNDNAQTCAEPALRSCLVAPVISRTGTLLGGMFFAHPQPGQFLPDDEQLIAGLAAQSAIAIDNARLYRALRESEDQTRQQLEHINAIYATAPIGLCYLDRELRVISMNVHLKALIGASDIEVQGTLVHELLGPAAAAIEPLCRKLLAARQPIFDWEVSWRATDQSPARYWLCGGHPILDASGELQGINTVVQDITVRKNTELELSRLGDIVNSSYDAIIGKTLDGTITDWNLGAERVYGYTAEEAIGRSISIVLPDNRRQEGSEILAALREGTYLQLAEAERVRKDGEVISVSMTVSPIRDASGTIVGASTIGRDITAQERAEQAIRASEARMRFILQATNVGTWDWDMRTNKVRWSESLEELHGRPRGSFQGTFESALADVHPEDKALIDAALAAAVNGAGDFHVEYRVVLSDGRIRWVEGKGQLVFDAADQPERMAGICMDVTERKESEQALRTSETLLRSQTEELAIAHRQKDEFLAMLAHELRNPLAPISNSVQLLKIQGPEQREQSLPWAIDVIDRQVGQISRLVDDLLDVARITRGHIELRPEYMDLNEVVVRAAEAAAPWFEAKHQNFELHCADEPVPVLVDAVRMIQAVSNLLNNAAKFTAEHGIIRLRLQRDRDEAVICVADTGTGISPDVLSHVFELFTQGDRSLDRRQGGLGLGLPLVRRLVEMHDGRVVAISPGMGRGSEFVIRLPLSLAVGPDPNNRSNGLQNAQAQRPIRILIVDDNVQSADAMAVLLETLGHEATAAYNGPTAFRIAKEARPELVFLDIGLPLMDGYEVAKILRERYGRSIRLVALSGYAPREAETHLGPASFDDYILKLISFEKLTAILSEHMDARLGAD